MTKNIIEMAKEAGIRYETIEFYQQELTAFADLVAAKATAKEREACAKVCAEDSAQAMDFTYGTVVGGYFAEIIRARGEA
jgi:hypothetical protein